MSDWVIILFALIGGEACGTAVVLAGMGLYYRASEAVPIVGLVGGLGLLLVGLAIVGTL